MICDAAGREIVYSELEEFAARHPGILMPVIRDSDWHGNPLVIDQTNIVAAQLRAFGILAVGCAPREGVPLGWDHPIKGPMVNKVGVDDMLGEHELDERHDAVLDALVVHEAIEDVPSGFASLLERLGLGRRDGADTAARLARDLIARSTPARLVTYPRKDIAERLGRNPSTVDDARKRLEKLEAIVLVDEAERVYSRDGFRMRPSVYRLAPDLLVRATGKDPAPVARRECLILRRPARGRVG